jgi:HSP20 family protein
MRTRRHAVVLPLEVGEFADEVQRVFLDLDRTAGGETPTGEYSPALDVFETDDAIQIVADLPGVPAAAVHVIVKGGALLVAGVKAPRRARGDSSFHLVERGFGRFARMIRIPVVCDTSRATAGLADGELRIVIPKIADRRGRAVHISIK